ncbi:uncharacterized protein LOC110820498 [Carica papaya]|uniref:uncharacterized protein LOC110820498 n=1 Tax=Carica papaya TaxID=3649 RepID=UPI000B8CF88D|nr:uncharacterized protein LOC110820498 [Carica papaya]XP_021905672.1 uncharacterized protein LOC110820498 [Carica papaya]
MRLLKLCLELPQFRPTASAISYGYLSTHKCHKEFSTVTDSQPLTLSYLQNSCGLPLESAILASKKLRIYATHNPDSVLNLLKSHGLTQSHIKSLITNRPSLLLVDPDKTLKPNLELFRTLGFSTTSLAKLLNMQPKVLEVDAPAVVDFFRASNFAEKQIATLTIKRPALYLFNAQKKFKPKIECFESLGFSATEISKILSTEPAILERSLENQIKPSISILRDILGNDKDIVEVIKKNYRILEINLDEVLVPNISLLVSHGVPKELCLKIFLIEPKSLLVRGPRFGEIVNEVINLHFDPNNLLFVLAVRSMAIMSKTLWEKKLEAFGSFGLSRDEIYSAFKLQPMCMICSEKKIRKSMNFFVNKLSITPLTIAKNPNLLLLSLEKRIIPRCSVLQILMSKNLIKENISIIYIFRMAELKFVEKIVTKYQDLVPNIVDAHQGKIEFTGFLTDPKV